MDVHPLCWGSEVVKYVSRKNTDWDYIQRVAAYLKGSEKWSGDGEKEEYWVVASPCPGHAICFNLMEIAEGWEIAYTLES